VLLDMTMPHMDGEETFRELRRIKADVRVILSSGYSEQDATVQFAGKGLRLPLVWNSGGYDSPEALALLDGVIDVYLPDMKFADSEVARQYLGVKDYAEVNQRAVKEMHRQVADLVLDNGIARRGLLVRHLVLPENLAGTDRILASLAREISPHTSVNLMDQYRPCYRADEYPPLDRRPTRAEMAAAHAVAEKWGLKRLDKG
jgi:putative pyruvate formate lyase activating enzyme